MTGDAGPDVGKYYENDQGTVVEVTDVDGGSVTYRLEHVGGAPVSGDKTRTESVEDFDLIFDECGAGVSFAGP